MRCAAIEDMNTSASWTRFRPENSSAKATVLAMSLVGKRELVGVGTGGDSPQ
jgi:hypothetical protein